MNSIAHKIGAIAGKLGSTDEESRRAAVLALAEFPVEETRELLFGAMGDQSWRVRKEAVEALLKGPVSEEMMEGIVALLASQDNAGLRNSAVEALERLGNSAVQVLCRHSQDPDNDVRKFVLDILGSIGDAGCLPVLINALDDPEPNVCASAAENLGKIGDAGALPYLLDALKRPDIWLRFTVLDALGKIGAPVPLDAIAPLAEENLLKKALFDCLGSVGGGEAIPLLLQGMRERVKAVRDSAVVALMRIRDRLPEGVAAAYLDGCLAECKGAPLVEGLLSSLDTTDRNLKESLVRILGLIGDERAIGLLLQACRDDRLRGLALASVRGIGDRAAEVVPGLYSEADDEMRCMIAFVCGELCLSGCASLLVRGMRSDNALLRGVSAVAAGKTGNPDLIGEISVLLQDPDHDVRTYSIDALSLIARVNGEAVRGVAGELAASPNPENRCNGALLYGAMADGERLSLLVKDEDAKVRRTVVNAMKPLWGRIGITPLVMALVDENSEVRIAAADALGEPGRDEALPPLLLALKDQDLWVRCAALRSLGRIGHGGAREDIIALLEETEDGLLTITALETLAKIGGEGVMDRVKKALESNDEEVVNSAIGILSGSGSGWIEECGERLLRHPHWDVRRNFIRAMSNTLGEKAVPRLRRALESENDVLVREQILEFLDRYL